MMFLAGTHPAIGSIDRPSQVNGKFGNTMRTLENKKDFYVSHSSRIMWNSVNKNTARKLHSIVVVGEKKNMPFGNIVGGKNHNTQTWVLFSEECLLAN